MKNPFKKDNVENLEDIVFDKEIELDKNTEDALKDAVNKRSDETDTPLSEDELMSLFDDCSDVELILMGDQARNGAKEAIDKVLNSDDFFEYLTQCISALHALYIYEKVLAQRNMEDKTLGELQKEYAQFLQKWQDYQE